MEVVVTFVAGVLIIFGAVVGVVALTFLFVSHAEQKTKCRFGFHDWTVWKSTGHVYTTKSGSWPGGGLRCYEYTRYCKCCGLTKINVEMPDV